MKIYCPLCEYAPHAGDRWTCVKTCGTVWNTFETRGRCPGCGKQWAETCCPACVRWSAHEAWYHEEAGDAATETDARPARRAWDPEEERETEREEELVGVP